MSAHLQRLIEDAVRTELGPLGQAIEDVTGELTDEQRRVVGVGLQQALMIGLRVAFAEAAAQLDEQGVHVHLVLALEAEPPPG